VSAYVVALLEEAARVGVVLRIEGRHLVADPKGLLPPALARRTREHRAEILALLAAAVPPPRAPCWNCHGTKFFARHERLTWVCARCHPSADAASMVWHDSAMVAARPSDTARVQLRSHP